MGKKIYFCPQKWPIYEKRLIVTYIWRNYCLRRKAFYLGSQKWSKKDAYFAPKIIQESHS